jgi:hypothetical protein
MADEAQKDAAPKQGEDGGVEVEPLNIAPLSPGAAMVANAVGQLVARIVATRGVFASDVLSGLSLVTNDYIGLIERAAKQRAPLVQRAAAMPPPIIAVGR